MFISVFSAFGEKIESPLTIALAPGASIRENTIRENTVYIYDVNALYMPWVIDTQSSAPPSLGFNFQDLRALGDIEVTCSF